jgi:DNA-binding CsgD family transcriptional regulator
MLVAFISECQVFAGILSKAIGSNYEGVRFEYYSSPDEFLASPFVAFPIIVFKLTDQEKFDSKVSHIKQSHPASQIIGLMLGKSYKTLKGREKHFNYLFTDGEIEDKLQLFITQQLSVKPELNKNIEIESIKRKYIHLHPVKSRCFSLVIQGKKASEIASEMNKSTRTIEKYIVYLRDYFQVAKKKDLIEIGKFIQA